MVVEAELANTAIRPFFCSLDIILAKNFSAKESSTTIIIKSGYIFIFTKPRPVAPLSLLKLHL